MLVSVYSLMKSTLRSFSNSAMLLSVWRTLGQCDSVGDSVNGYKNKIFRSSFYCDPLRNNTSFRVTQTMTTQKSQLGPKLHPSDSNNKVWRTKGRQSILGWLWCQLLYKSNHIFSSTYFQQCINYLIHTHTEYTMEYTMEYKNKYEWV